MLYNHVKSAWKEAILAYNTAQNSGNNKDAMNMIGPAIIQLSQVLEYLETMNLPNAKPDSPASYTLNLSHTCDCGKQTVKDFELLKGLS